MSTMMYQIDPRKLVRWLGTDGARAGLMHSKRITIDVLRKMAESLDIRLPEKTTRQHWIDEIVKVACRRIDKPIQELFEMDEQALLDYFERVDVESSEVLDILKELDVSPRREGRRSLLEFAAKELSETGRFMRIAGNQSAKNDVQNVHTNGGKRDARRRDFPDPQTSSGAPTSRRRD
jgi:hypothetical protein